MATTMAPGTADFVTTITFTRTVKRFGFTAYLVDQGDRDAVYLAAQRWKGRQPLLCIHRCDEGHGDWLALLMASPEINGKMRFVGAAGAAHTAYDQWVTQGPSKLLLTDDET